MNCSYLVSVVLPIYNVEKYLDRCINSIVNQTYKNLEIILVDDESPDNCPFMCDNWANKDKRIKVIHKKNEGLGFARNTGIENATGDFICFIDSDDFIELNTIEACVSRLIKDTSDIVIYGCKNINTDGTIISQIIPNCPQMLYKASEVQEIFLPQLISPLKGNWEIVMSSCYWLYNLKTINDIKFRFVSEREIISEDIYSLLKLFKSINAVSVIEEPFYNYCVNITSLTHTYRKDRYDKNKYFYLESIKLVKELEYNCDVLNAIQGPFLSNTIATFKMIAKSNESFLSKIKEFKQILNDDTLQGLIRSENLFIENLKKRILYWSIKNKFVLMVFLLSKFKK